MSRIKYVVLSFVLSGSIACGLAGCGDGKSSQAEVNHPSKSDENVLNFQKLPTVSLPSTTPSEQTTQPKPKTPFVPKLPERGTPHWYVHKMLMVRVLTYPDPEKPAAGKKPITIEQLRKLRRERNLEIVELAEEAIPLTAQDPKLLGVFNTIVRQLVESRVILARQGQQKDIDELYQLVDYLYNARQKKPKAAENTVYQAVLFANRRAREEEGTAGRQALGEFVHWARRYAVAFPQQKIRAVQLLDAAARSCEYQYQIKDATLCYQQILKNYPGVAQAKRAMAALRRLQLVGQPLTLKGPTLEGGFLDIQDSRGKAVLVVFWATGHQQFNTIVPQLQAVRKAYSRHDLEIIGVSLDSEELNINKYLEKFPMPWPHVFYLDRKKRGGNNLIARHYAVGVVPTIWLVDPSGKVVDLHVNPKKVGSQIRNLLRKRIVGQN